MKYFLIITLLSLLGACSSETAKQDDMGSSKDALITDTSDASAKKDLSKDVRDTGGLFYDATDKDTSKDLGNNECGKPRTVIFLTSDSVKLAADYHPPKTKNIGAVILLHMVPPSNDRKGYPLRVREAFSELGFAVLNVDRRGAGESEGNPKEAYGPQGHKDVEAAVSYLISPDRKCTSDPKKLFIIGASNGTTAVMDYTVKRTDKTLPDPKALAWLSPGGYTETQNTVAANKSLLEKMPLLIVHPLEETWTNTYKAFSKNWKILTLEGGKHGTGNFDKGKLEKIQLPALVDWAKTHIN